jgi:PIN domain nuclease of toxin-antitoxin system
LKILLDSHAFIWSTVEPHRLSKTARRFFTTPGHELIVSIASLWEITIKMARGKLIPLGASIEDVVDALRRGGIALLPVHTSHLVQLESLPLHHRDPFDRLLIAQAIEENLTILTDDTHFRRYPVKTVW